jgi:hypothetical protein
MARESNGNQKSDPSVYNVSVEAEEGLEQVQQLLCEKPPTDAVRHFPIFKSADRQRLRRKGCISKK